MFSRGRQTTPPPPPPPPPTEEDTSSAKGANYSRGALQCLAVPAVSFPPPHFLSLVFASLVQGSWEERREFPSSYPEQFYVTLTSCAQCSWNMCNNTTTNCLWALSLSIELVSLPFKKKEKKEEKPFNVHLCCHFDSPRWLQRPASSLVFQTLYVPVCVTVCVHKLVFLLYIHSSYHWTEKYHNVHLRHTPARPRPSHWYAVTADAFSFFLSFFSLLVFFVVSLCMNLSDGLNNPRLFLSLPFISSPYFDLKQITIDWSLGSAH